MSIIISASRRTDIPAFYSEWFINRVREGFFIKVNPYNSKQRKPVSLESSQVDCIVFWTKNPLPLLDFLPELTQRGYRYLFQFTLNDYPVIFEPRVPSLQKRLDIFKRISEQSGSARVIWRYDPIILSQMTSLEYHLDRFNTIAENLQGYTQRVMISFLTFYSKVQHRFCKLDSSNTWMIRDIRAEDERENLISLANGLSRIARENGIEIYSCAEKLNLDKYQIQHGSCIDIQLINRLFGLSLIAKKDKYQRAECQCVESVDMGLYDTCKYGCSYCYANTRQVDFKI